MDQAARGISKEADRPADDKNDGDNIQDISHDVWF